MSMIRINLLPQEYRIKARTPIKVMLGIAAAVAVNAGLVAWLAYVHFAVQVQVESEKGMVQSEVDGLKPQLDYYASLDTESKQYKSREQTLSSITKSRINWTRKLDEFIDVCSRGGDGERHLVWFDDFQVTQNLDPKAKTPGSVRASGHSGSDNFGQVANFLEDIETSSFVSDFEAPAPPEGSQTLKDETLVPAVAIAFPLALTMKPRDDAAKPAGAKGGAKGAAKGGAKPAAPAAGSGAAPAQPAADKKGGGQ